MTASTTNSLTTSANARIVLVGHPFAPIGRGEDMRATFRALTSVGLNVGVFDVFGLQQATGSVQQAMEVCLTEQMGDINIFVINADEVERTLEVVRRRTKLVGRTIIYPQWELAKFPQKWVPLLNQFDEIWAPSQFVHDSLASRVAKPMNLALLASEVELDSFLGREYFGIASTDYVFLFMFDLRSFYHRKNPEAVLTCFQRVVKSLPSAHTSLVLKVNGADQEPERYAQLVQHVNSMQAPIRIIGSTLSDDETKNLIRDCDCFVSMHRSEGFGRGMAEAMFLGKPTIATGYSGNLDFMDAMNSYLLPSTMIPVKEGEYPEHEDQMWADADQEVAFEVMSQLVTQPDTGYQMGRTAAGNVRQSIGYRARGLHYFSLLFGDLR